MIAVLSPAKTINLGATKAKLTSKPALLGQTAKLLPACKKLTVADIKKAAGVSDAIASLNVSRYQAFEKCESKQACIAFDGPAFRGLKAEDFSGEEQKFAQDHIRILSGLYGVLRPYDEIRPYRLEMGMKIATPRGPTLYDFWGDEISKQLGRGLKVLVNCASQEYWKAVRPKALPAGVQIITCDFPGPAVYAKKARGMMCRHIVKKRCKHPDDLKKFVGEGADKYAFNPAKSTPTKLVFLRQSGGAKAKAAAEPATKKRPATADAGSTAKRSRK